jgi:hypothetical protein
VAEPELAALQQAHHRRLLGVQDGAGDLVAEAWDTFAGLDDVAAAQFEAAASLIVDTAKAQTSTLAVAYMNANDRVGGFPGADLVPVMPSIRGGIPPAEVYHRSIVEARARIADGADFDAAMSAGRARAVATARTDVVLANKAEISRGGALRPWVVGYRRVLTGKSCGFCATASTQRYRSADLLPLHTGCDCDVAEIFGREDPGQVINRQLLTELKDVTPEVGGRPFLVEADGSIRFTKTEKVLGPDGVPLRTPSGEFARRVVPGDPIRVKVVDHGELGPMLTNAKHATKTAPELAQPAVRRTRANVQDPDVLAEARRRNVTPDRVIELREQKAERRFLEDRARREAAKNLAADSPDVLRVAEKYGVSPDEVLSARARVADVRKVAREAAAREQANVLAELDRISDGSPRIKNPPRTGAKTGTGRTARGGEYDWLEQISDREKARLSRTWYGGGQGPDQLAATMSNALGRDIDVDEAMRVWMDLNRRAEAAGALRRGKLPSLDAYSGQIDADDLLASITDDGYELARVFGDDLDAAGHIASVERELVQREALDYLGDAVSPVNGQSPYRMSFQSWEEEVRDLEYLFRENLADDAARARYAELVPQYLDEPGLDFEDLYARIVTTARKAGEEVPDYATIPWR